MASAAAVGRKVARAQFRALMREASRLEGGTLALVRPVDVWRVGRGSYVEDAASSARALQRDVFPGVDFDSCGHSGTAAFSAGAVRDVIRANFRAGTGTASAAETPDAAARRLDAGFAHLRTLNNLRAAEPCHTVTRTKYADGVVVDVELTTESLRGLPDFVMSELGAYPFVYRVKISNAGTELVQLIGRQWLFTDEAGNTQTASHWGRARLWCACEQNDVCLGIQRQPCDDRLDALLPLLPQVPRMSPGVVGHSPVLEPGQSFEYVSSTQLKAPNGTMEGSFQLQVGAGEDVFDVAVARTALRGHAEARAKPQGAEVDGSGELVRSKGR
jgi:uncharacterized protein affecting Mg2+/Co2+ transport